uniref:Uncharacterized protein n=1 Tax=Arundo donax TaxID=35708 RepID=A0A0A9FZE1_ARUDO
MVNPLNKTIDQTFAMQAKHPKLRCHCPVFL